MKENAMHTLRFDVMQNDRYVCTLSYKFCPAFTIAAADLREFAIKQRPSLRGQEINIIINGIPRNFNETSTKLQRNFNEIPRKVNGVHFVTPTNNNAMIPTVTPTNTHIEGSCFCRPPKTIKAYLLGLRERVASPEYTICARSLRSLSDEWEAHNLLYSLGIARDRTESVDLDAARWYTEAAYFILACIYKLLWKYI